MTHNPALDYNHTYVYMKSHTHTHTHTIQHKYILHDITGYTNVTILEVAFVLDISTDIYHSFERDNVHYWSN